jgi:hypothetical protein
VSIFSVTVIAQHWSVKVVSSSTHFIFPVARPILLKCQVGGQGGVGRDFIEVSGWQRDGKFITNKFQRLYYGEYCLKNSCISDLFHYFYTFVFLMMADGDGDDEDETNQNWTILPNGDLVIEGLLEEDSGAKVICHTRHKITKQEISSQVFTIYFSGMRIYDTC